MNCLTCKHVVKRQPPDQGILVFVPVYDCVRFPPTPLAFQQNGQVALTSLYPVVSATTTPCHEYELQGEVK